MTPILNFVFRFDWTTFWGLPEITVSFHQFAVHLLELFSLNDVIMIVIGNQPR